MQNINEYVLRSKKPSLVNEYVSKYTISSIDEYLLSKKHPNASSHAIQDEYCLVGAYGEAYQELVDDYADCMIESEACFPNLFLLKKQEIRPMLEDPENQIIVYKIPSKFNTLSDMDKFQEEYDTGMHDPDEDLEEILPEDL